MSDPNRKAEKLRLREEKDTRYATAVADAAQHGVEFIPFPKIPRLNRPITITEKIDGTNAAIHITGRYSDERGVQAYKVDLDDVNDIGVIVPQSRQRLITPEQDNFGFARWVKENAQALREVLGPGVHFGEWWGQGIQRGYRQDRKWFSLFNYTRWSNDPSLASLASIGVQVVPILYHGPWMAVVGGPDATDVYPQRDAEGKVTPGVLRFAPDVALAQLEKRGSVAAMVNGITYKRTLDDNGRVLDKGPEGIIVFHEAGRLLFKATIEGDEQPKSQADVAHERIMRELEAEGIDDIL